GEDVLVVDQQLAGGRLEQPVDAAHERRLAGAGQAHDHEDLALADLERDVGDRHHAAGFLEDLILVGARREALQGALGRLPKDLGQMSHANFGFSGRHTPQLELWTVALVQRTTRKFGQADRSHLAVIGTFSTKTAGRVKVRRAARRSVWLHIRRYFNK